MENLSDINKRFSLLHVERYNRREESSKSLTESLFSAFRVDLTLESRDEFTAVENGPLCLDEGGH